MDIEKLKNEIVNDSLTRGYSGMTDAEVTVSLNDVTDRTTNKSSLTGSEVLNAIDKTEFNSKTADQKQQVWNIVHLGNINPFGIEASLLIDIFSGGSATITALQALRKNNVSRAQELNMGIVKTGYVERARAV